MCHATLAGSLRLAFCEHRGWRKAPIHWTYGTATPRYGPCFPRGPAPKNQGIHSAGRRCAGWTRTNGDGVRSDKCGQRATASVWTLQDHGCTSAVRQRARRLLGSLAYSVDMSVQNAESPRRRMYEAAAALLALWESAMGETWATRWVKRQGRTRNR